MIYAVTFSLLFAVLGKPAFITKLPRKLFLKCPPCAIAETEGVNLVDIDTLISSSVLCVKHIRGTFQIFFKICFS